MDVSTRRRDWVKFRKRGGWLSAAWDLGQGLRPAAMSSDQLFVVGTETFDPWHVTAHLDDEATLAGLGALRPTLLRCRPPADAPPHLRRTVRELEQVGRRHAVLVVAPDAAGEHVLQRLDDVRRRGGSVFAVGGDEEVASIAHESVVIPPPRAAAEPDGDFAIATHLVTVSAGTLKRRQPPSLRR